MTNPAGDGASIEERALALARICQTTASGRARGLRRRLSVLQSRLEAAERRLGAIEHAGAELGRASEWVLDNAYLVAESMHQVIEGLPSRFYRQLPRLTDPAMAAWPRAYAVAREVANTDEVLDLDRAAYFLNVFQDETPLTMGELWAFPTMLRLVMLERLQELVGEITIPDDAEKFVPAPGTVARRIGVCVTGLRIISAHAWNEFFESVSLVERILSNDPAQVYRRMDFATRDRYRKAVERLAEHAGVREESVAAAAIAVTENASGPMPPHVGFCLLGDRVDALLRELGCRTPLKTRVSRRLRRYATPIYLAGILLATLGVLFVPISYVASQGGTALHIGLLIVTALIPAVSLAVSLVHWLITHLKRPRVLPKMDFDDAIPADCRAIVVVPTLLTSAAEVRDLLRKIEVRFQGNRDENLRFALLTDFADAPTRTVPADDALLEQARKGVQSLNEQYGGGTSRSVFYLFHRERRWNESEGCWMGWERKRGKLAEFNRFLLGDGETSYCATVGNQRELAGIRYVITLDADTGLPRGAAAKLVATLAHPLNRARFDEQDRVTSGYTVLQPRIEMTPRTASGSLFAILFHGDTGLDLYSRAVSDVYQDFFGEGIYAGKGIYDVAAFERSLAGRVPENALLSHDLFEGVHGRAGLVSDLALFEEYPDHVLAFTRRMHRWIRGDWQLLPWLLPTIPGEQGRVDNRLSLISRWKILDNLRRSLVAPAVLVFLTLAWLWQPGAPWFWSLLGLGVVGIPILFSAASVATRLATGAAWSATLKGAAWSFPTQLFRFVVAVIFLPYETVVVIDAVVRTVYRLRVSRKNLLQWTSAAHTARALSDKNAPVAFWREMAKASILGLGIGVVVWLVNPSAVPAAMPLVVLWVLSPQIAWGLSAPREERPQPLPLADRRALRLLARRTWYYFERFIGPSDHWLAPDNFQEEPRAVVARRTSPTNIGLATIAPLAAYDFGYLGVLTLAATLRNIMDSLTHLERYRGHFLNWYETINRTALLPRYVSTVDSGNLAACLIVVKEAITAIRRMRLVRETERQGLLDTVEVLSDIVQHVRRHRKAKGLEAVREHLNTLKARVRECGPGPRPWQALLQELKQEWLERFNTLVADLLGEQAGSLDSDVLKDLRSWSDRVRYAIVSPLRELQLLIPWLPLLDTVPEAYERADGKVGEAWQALRALLEGSPTLRGLVFTCTKAQRQLEVIEQALSATGVPEADVNAIRQWNGSLRDALELARRQGEELLADLHMVSTFAAETVDAMDFGFLFDSHRRLFHIGYNVSVGEFDTSYYDLLASEARIASLIAIAKGDVPASHWLYLRRPFGRVRRRRVLLSWSGTMFEFLMPNLFTEVPKDSILARSAELAVRRQIEFAEDMGVPWGISESGFYQLDAHANYQYRAFGVPGLGLRPDLGDRLVISPYASLLAVAVNPPAVASNLQHFEGLGMVGRYGLFEAVDYGPSASRAIRDGAIVRSYMTHHQGMILQALNNYLNANVTVRRFHRDARVASTELLLYEHPPRHVPVERRAQPVGRTERPVRRPVATESWIVPAHAPVPPAHVLTNRRFSVLVTARGGGYSRWQDVALTRWRSDPSMDAWGTWIYVRDLDAGTVWSIGAEPTRAEPEAYEVQFAPHMAEYSRHDHGISVRMDVTVPPSDDLEVRRVTLVNDGEITRRLELTSYGEVVLADEQEDLRHPAFNKLFVQSSYVPASNVLVFQRRPRAADEEPLFLAHGVSVHDASKVEIVYESDREAFLGRGRAPYAPDFMGAKGARVSVAGGSTLDPIFSLSCKLEVPAKREVVLVFVTAAGRSRAEVLAAQEGFRSLTRVDFAFDQSRSYCEFELHEAGIPADEVRPLQELLSALLYPYHGLRTVPRTLNGDHRPQSGLWAHGISGDHPMLVVRVGPSDDLALVRRLLAARRYWRRRGVRVDLVILDEGSTGYLQPLHDRLEKTITDTGADLANPREGIFLLGASQLEVADRQLLERSARVILRSGGGPLAAQLARLYSRREALPGFVPVAMTAAEERAFPPLPREEGLRFPNEHGGFSADGREYVMHLESGEQTPAPWSNVVANPAFGFLVSESGAGTTWAANSGENRLTAWHNDPVTDEPSEVLYLRDEESARVWTPTPGPAASGEPYQVRHGAGYTAFRHHSHGIEQQMVLFVAKDDPVKLVRLTLRNFWQRARRLTATYFVDWVLGTTRTATGPHLLTQYDAEAQALLVRNPFHNTYGERVAFLAASQSPHGLTADREEFLGEPPSLSHPAGLYRIGLSGTTGTPVNPCGALQIHIDLPPGETREVHFLLGQGADRDHAVSLVKQYRPAPAAAGAFDAVRSFWDERLGALSVETPDAAMDVMLNRWLQYQSIACRLWGRSAFYQSSGAFGFRDQLQDVLAVVATWPELARAHILEAARHQFREGDVLHWWHPDTDQGVRTRCSDDLVWLPFATAEYVTATGDQAILAEEVPYLVGPSLGPMEQERFGVFETTRETRPLYDHCVRALERALTAGQHQLPLIGSCDWNDGFSRVGIEGRGESVWLAWFLHATLTKFAPLCEANDDPTQAAQYRDQAAFLRQAAEEYAWDGAWYRRAYYDDGTPIGSAESDEAQIDSIAQSWSVLSNAGREDRVRRAIGSALDRLVRPDDRLMLLLTPPFDKTKRDPGYIKGYPPGVRENGGQYTHAAAWLASAVARLGDGDRAHALFQLLNPILHANSSAGASRYRVEPYVIAADVYGEPPHVGRGGWTWYTGSAAWVYRLGIEEILGIRMIHGALAIDPCLPQDWPGYRAVLRHGKAEYHISVENLDGAKRGPAEVTLDGKTVALPVALDGRRGRHELVVQLGRHEPDRDEVSSGAATGER